VRVELRRDTGMADVMPCQCCVYKTQTETREGHTMTGGSDRGDTMDTLGGTRLDGFMSGGECICGWVWCVRH
jgi:hypothetical protein